jgi:adenylosuccinate synthase
MVTAVVGANWGDEGKGKITDMLADEADIVIRFQGGANAGHTIVNNYGKFALHTLPSGVFHSHITNIIGNGVALDIPKVISEIKSITDRNVPAPKIMISDRAQIVMPYHVLFDQYEEERLGKNSFGSTKSGIAPFYSDKYAKIKDHEADNCDQDRARRGNALFFHSELPAENHQTAHHDKICNPSRKRLDQDIGKKLSGSCHRRDSQK